jgi:hypothetical protein
MTQTEREYAKKRILDKRTERDRAKQIILEILRQSGGSLGKTKLFKAFWLAHLYFSKSNAGYLSAWKIVRLPHGPGIDKGDALILELKKSGEITISHEPKGPYLETVCKIADSAKPSLSNEAVEAIVTACRVVGGHDNASQISEWSHEFSRSWGTTPNGCELDIYSDLIPDDVYEERRQNLVELNEIYDDLFK